MIRFMQRHRTIWRFVCRGPVRAWVAGRVWASVWQDPHFRASIEEGMRDLHAGRIYRVETIDGVRWSIPNPDWPNDGPQPMEPRPW